MSKGGVRHHLAIGTNLRQTFPRGITEIQTLHTDG